MPTRIFFNKFSKNELFAVFPPGFYILMVAYSCYVASQACSSSSLWSVFAKLAGAVRDNPAYLLFILFAAYLFGSIFRALPVAWAERTIPWFTSHFPYENVLEETLSVLNRNTPASKHNPRKGPSLSRGLPKRVFNYWKDALCVNSPEGFEYYQAYEARSRLFAGMIWAGWSGVVGSAVALGFAWRVSPSIGLGMLILSAAMLGAFGCNFRRVRRQEAQALLLIYTAWLQSQGS